MRGCYGATKQDTAFRHAEERLLPERFVDDDLLAVDEFDEETIPAAPSARTTVFSCFSCPPPEHQQKSQIVRKSNSCGLGKRQRRERSSQLGGIRTTHGFVHFSWKSERFHMQLITMLLESSEKLPEVMSNYAPRPVTTLTPVTVSTRVLTIRGKNCVLPQKNKRETVLRCRRDRWGAERERGEEA